VDLILLIESDFDIMSSRASMLPSGELTKRWHGHDQCYVAFLPRDAMLARYAMLARISRRRVSVCLSVTLRYYINLW